MWEISSLAEELFASQDGFYSLEVDSYLTPKA